MAIVGVPIAGMVVATTTLLQHATTDAFRGRVLDAIGAAAAFSTLVGAQGDRVGIVTMLNIQGLGYGLAGLMVLVLLPASIAAEPAPEASAGVAEAPGRAATGKPA